MKEDEGHWICYMFGSKDSYGLTWQPEKGKEPCWFWRKMQYIFFGNKWVKVGEDE